MLRALARERVERPPVWLMRQAGRYLPEYRRLREEAGDILNLFRSPELAMRAAMQPLERYPLDAAILFSDILTIPDAMGLGLFFKEGEGPSFERPIDSASKVRALSVVRPEEQLSYVMEAVRLTCQSLEQRIPLIGFSGSPWTLATYMVEGGSSQNFSKILGLRREQPKLLFDLLEVLTNSVGEYLAAQIRAGVQVVQIFDTWGGILEQEDYDEFSLRWITDALEIARAQSQTPYIVFCKDGARSLEQMVQRGVNAISVDHTCRLSDVIERVDERIVLQGNLDPAILCQSPDNARDATREILEQCGDRPGYIFNLGHGISPDAKLESVAQVVETCHAFAYKS